MRKSSAATADSATKLSADEPGEVSERFQMNLSHTKTGHLSRDYALGRGASFLGIFSSVDKEHKFSSGFFLRKMLP